MGGGNFFTSDFIFSFTVNVSEKVLENDKIKKGETI